MKKLLFCILCTLLFPWQPLHAADEAPAEAVQVITRLNNTLLQCMQQGEKLGYQGRYALLEPVMKKSFSYEFMLKKSTGSFWKKLDPEQKKELLDRYTTWSVGSYAQRFSTFSGQEFTIVAARPVRQRFVEVVSRISRPGKEPKDLSYILMDTDGRWLIVDIQVQGVSQLSMTRAQFRSILKDKGFAGLRAVLDEKIANLDKKSDG
jgi:phospholipid transport system substrate-binding protein